MDPSHLPPNEHVVIIQEFEKSDASVTVRLVTFQLYKRIIETSICDATVSNYSALLADEGNISISQLYTSKLGCLFLFDRNLFLGLKNSKR
jgi:hypothetical protein